MYSLSEQNKAKYCMYHRVNAIWRTKIECILLFEILHNFYDKYNIFEMSHKQILRLSTINVTCM